MSFPWIAWEALDAVWAENPEVVSSYPIYDLVEKNFESEPTNLDTNDHNTLNIVKLGKRIRVWLEKIDYNPTSLAKDFKELLRYFLKLGTVKNFYFIFLFIKVVLEDSKRN